jgi:hypothetical protein
MKTILTTILIIITCLTQTFGQNSKYDFAKGVFKKEYKKQNHETFSGQVGQINERTFSYGDKVLIVDTEDSRLLTIFSKGIFHPNIIDKRLATKPLTKVQLDTLTESEQVFYNLARNDSTTIGNLEELERLNPDLKRKRFVFWLYRKGMMNPTECYFELFNDKGTKDMAIEEFIKDSKLTFYYRGTIII